MRTAHFSILAGAELQHLPIEKGHRVVKPQSSYAEYNASHTPTVLVGSSGALLLRELYAGAVELFLHFGHFGRLNIGRSAGTPLIQRRLPLRNGFLDLALFEIDIPKVVVDGGVL